MFLSEGRQVDQIRSALLAGCRYCELGYGRFMQADPLGYEDGLNMYAYTGGDPINASDPTGTVTDAWYKLEQKIDGSGPTYLAAINREAAEQHAAQVTQIQQADKNGDGYIDETEKQALDPGLQKLAQSLPSYHPFSLPVYNKGSDIVVTASIMVSDSEKYALVGGRYYRNPNYVDPAPWLNLENFVRAQIIVGSFAATPGLPALTARGTGLLNTNDFVRLGYGWSQKIEDTVFRVGIGKRWIHIDLLPKLNVGW